MTVQSSLNGVDVNQLMETISTIKEQPEIARFKFRASNEWVDGAQSKTTIKSFYGAGQEDSSRTKPFELSGDEPPVLLGNNNAPNAVETVLHALTSCLSVGFIYNAAAQNINVEKLEMEVEGDIDLHGFLGLSDQIRPGYENIKLTYKVKADAPDEKIAELCEQVKKTSPVLDIISRPVPVSIKMQKN
jgi:uncharacterized OsmC-like protein